MSFGGTAATSFNILSTTQITAVLSRWFRCQYSLISSVDRMLKLVAAVPPEPAGITPEKLEP